MNAVSSPFNHAACVAFAALFTVCAAQPAMAQSAPTAVSSTVLEETTLVELEQLQFGMITQPSTVSILRINSRTGVMTVNRGNAVPIGGTVSRGHFSVTGTPRTYVLVEQQAGSVLLTNDNGDTMRLDRFGKSVGNKKRIPASGTFDFYIGGRLRIKANQAPGHYSGTYEVAVTYF